MNRQLPSFVEAQVNAIDKTFLALQDLARGSVLADTSSELLTIFALKFISDTRAFGQLSIQSAFNDWETVVHEGDGHALGARILNLARVIEREIEVLRDVFTCVLLSNIQRWQPNFLDDVVLQLSALSMTYIDDEGVPAFARWFDRRVSMLMESGTMTAESATPFSLAELMASVADLRPNLTVLDPCCGIGTLLTRAAQIVCIPGKRCGLYGQEINVRPWSLCKLRLFLFRLSVDCIALGDSLREPTFISNNAVKQFDRVMCDMPLGLQFHSEELAQVDRYGRFPFGGKSRVSSQSAFILHLISSLKNNGLGVVVVSHGFLFRFGADARVREKLIELGYVKAVIGLPAKLRTQTPIETALILFEKQVARKVLFIDAAALQDPIRGKTEISTTTTQRICTLLNSWNDEPGISHLASVEEIRNAKYSLVPRHYIDLPIDPVRNIESLQAEVQVWESEYQQVIKEMDLLLSDLHRES